MIDLNNIARQSLKIAEHRKLETDALSCLKHCAGEVIEAMDAYGKWRNEDYTTTKEEFENELADVIICILSVSGSEGIDIEQAISRKMLINEGRVKNGLCQ